MVLIGSFHTNTTHGVSGATASSMSGSSSSTGDGAPDIGTFSLSSYRTTTTRLGQRGPRDRNLTGMAIGARPLVPSRLAPGGLMGHESLRRPTTRAAAYVALTKPR